MSDAGRETARGDRFAFGRNWSRFLRVLNDDRVRQAEASLREMLETNDLSGKSFLDIGSGSGLFSLAARRLGATVRSFDYDPHSVACTNELKRRYFPEDPAWAVEQGSVLDKDYLARLGTWDIVYSWGVLHHTGDMWKAMENAAGMVKPQGLLFIAIYNDEGGRSARWTQLKQLYNRKPWARPFLLAIGFLFGNIEGLGNFSVGFCLDVLGVKGQQLVHVEHGGGPAQVLQGEFFNELFSGEKLLVSVGPAKPDKVVENGVGQDAHFLVLAHAHGPVAL